jgi:hypothetical protein
LFYEIIDAFSIVYFILIAAAYNTLLGAKLSGKSRILTQLPTLKAYVTKSYSLLVNSYNIDERLGTS